MNTEFAGKSICLWRTSKRNEPLTVDYHKLDGEVRLFDCSSTHMTDPEEVIAELIEKNIALWISAECAYTLGLI